MEPSFTLAEQELMLHQRIQFGSRYTLAEQEMMLRVRIQRLCGSDEVVRKITPAGVKVANDGEQRFCRENGLSGEEHAARVRLIPGHVFEVYQECHAAYVRHLA